MRKFAIIGATLAVLGGATAATSIASASAAPNSAAASSVKVLHLISHQTSLQVIDIGKKGPSPGDQIIETTVDFAHGKRVDRSVLNCVDITVTAQRVRRAVPWGFHLQGRAGRVPGRDELPNPVYGRCHRRIRRLPERRRATHRRTDAAPHHHRRGDTAAHLLPDRIVRLIVRALVP